MLLLTGVVKSFWKFLNEKPIKSMRIKAHLDIEIMYPLGTKKLTNEKKNHFKF
jgi:hypothetical protein